MFDQRFVGFDDASTENCRKVCHRFWLCLRHAVTLISNVRTSASKKINDIDLSSDGLTNAFEESEEKFYGFRQTA